MSIGTGIFLSSILFAFIFIILVTRESWNWLRILKLGTLFFISLIAVSAFGIYAYDLWENQPKPQVELCGIKLGSTPEDIKFTKGNPSNILEDGRWVYSTRSTYNATSQSNEISSCYLVNFKESRVNSVLYICPEDKLIKCHLLGFTIGSSYEDIERKLGKPSLVKHSDDNFSRTYRYDKLNTFFGLKEGRVDAFGIYQPDDGAISHVPEK